MNRSSLLRIFAVFALNTLISKFVLAAPPEGAPSTPAPASTDYPITDYGAVSGGGDDRAAFTAAFAAARSGDRVIVPAGTYQISSSIVPKAGVALVGVGRDVSTIQFIGGGADRSMILLENGSNNVELTGFTLDGINQTAALQGIDGDGTSGHRIHDLRVRNIRGNGTDFGPHGIYFSANVTNSRIENNEFANIGLSSDWGAGIRLNHGSNNNRVTGNTIQNVGRGGILLHGATDTVIQRNTVTGSGKKGPGLGIEVYGASHRTIVEDNIIDHWLSLDGSNFVAVRRNTVKATDGSLQPIGLELAGASDVIFTKNDIGKGNHIGLSLSNDEPKQRVYIAHNMFSESETWGAQFLDDQGEIRQIYLYQNTFKLAEKNAPNLYNAATAGFRLLAVENGAGIRQLVFDSNQFINNDEIGIQFLGINDTKGIDELSFVGNTVSGNGDDALDLDETFNNVEWSGNTVTGNGTNNTLSNAGFSNQKPTVQVVAPASATVGSPVAFTVTYTDDSGLPASALLWDFEEGLPVVGMSPSHTYLSAGTYKVAVLAWDDKGRAAHATHTMVVSAPPSITNGPPPATASIGIPYGFTYQATGNPAPTFTVTTGAFSPGLALSSGGVLSGTPTQRGMYSGTVSAANGVGAPFTQNFHITVTATFNQWISTYFNAQQLADPAISGAAAAPQGDGVPNLLKYLHNINPAVPMTAADRAALPAVDIKTMGGIGYLTLTYRQCALISGVTVNVQTSVDLQGWQTVAPDVTQDLGADPSTGDPIIRVGVNATGATKFIRLNFP